MNCLFWNCQGLGVPLTIHTLGDILRRKNPNLVFLVETKATPGLVEKFKRKWNLNGIGVDRVGRAGGLALLWQKNLEVSLINFSNHHIDAEIILPGSNTKGRVTGFYGYSERHLRHLSWELLTSLRDNRSLPWIVGGDFNEILNNTEKEGGISRLPDHIEAFRDALEFCELTDIGFEGFPYTWSNNREAPDTVRSRIDRVCANNAWLHLFPQSRVQHLELPGSDHVPILFEGCCPSHSFNRRTRRPFRFEAMWIRRDDCEEVIRQQWESISNSNPVEDLLLKNEGCQIALQSWSKSTFSQPQRRIEKIQKKMHELRCGLQTENSKLELQNLKKELEEVYEEQDLYWRQRSKIQWIREGDRNTKFFHAKATMRNKSNRVNRIKDNSGDWVATYSGIEDVISRYFSHIFSSANPRDEEIDEVLGHFERRVSDEACQQLSEPFTEEEVTRAISQMALLKSPGPDGLPVLFYTKYWHIIGSDVISCVLDFLNNHNLSPSLNYTFLVLIPKVRQPEKITEYRPISLCNVVYKFGSKVLANRLKTILDDLISPNQSAFVPRRLITDNVLVAYEINHFIKLNKSRKSNYMAIKLDISKAYDRVEWKFLEKVLYRFRLPHSMVSIMMLCVTSVSYSFLFNGGQFGAVKPTRGIRQGDPISPYLFICCAEILISMIHQACNRRELHGIKIAPSAPVVSNLCFADDTFVFSHATEDDAISLKRILEKYARLSGQEINYEKSTMTFSPNTSSTKRDAISRILNFELVERHEKYLGMPTTMGKTRKQLFSYIRDRVWAKLWGWGEKLLSQAGKEILIKAVIQAIPTYVMSCFLLPKGLLLDIERVAQRYWWGSVNQRKMSWVSWKKLCETKTVGGMGFRDMWHFNVALLAKQAWRILTRPDLLLTRILKARYFPNGDLLSADLGSHPSATWRSICYVREYLYEGLHKRIGNGHQTSIWSEPWLANPGQCRIITKRPTHSSFPDKVSDIIDPIHHTWNENLINTFFWPVDRSRILDVPIGHMEVEDRWIWRLSKHGNFTFHSCYHNALNMEIKKNKRPSKREVGRSGEAWEWWKYVWKLQIPPKIKIFLWRFCSDILPTNENLCRRKISFSPQCMRCGVEIESALHVLLSCRDVGDIWICPPFDQLKLHSIQSHLQLFELLVTNLDKDSLNLATTVMWKCWDQRNKEMHGGNSLQAIAILSWCRDYLKEHSEHQLRSSLTQPQRLPTKWKPPDDGVIKINVDASFPRGETYYATSLVARNSRGECVFWMVHKFAGRPPVVDGEAHAILRALITAQEKEWPNIIVEEDNLQVITALRDKKHSVLPFGAFIEQSLSLSRVFVYCTFDFIRRSGNKLAHMLVSIYGHSCSEGTTLPSNLADIAQ